MSKFHYNIIYIYIYIYIYYYYFVILNKIFFVACKISKNDILYILLEVCIPDAPKDAQY